MPMPKSFVPDSMPKSFVPDEQCCICSASIPETKPFVRLKYKGEQRQYCVPCFDDLRSQFAEMLTVRIGVGAARRIVRTLPAPIPARY
jgi:hypothetical protein